MLIGGRVEPFLRHLCIVLPLALIPAAVLVGLVTLASHFVLGDLSDYARPMPSFSLANFVGTVIVAPIAETLMMAISLPLIHFYMRRIVVSALVSGLLWGLLHALITPLAFVGPAWAFFVLSASYLAWRDVSFKKAFAVAFIPHAFNNALILSALYLYGS